VTEIGRRTLKIPFGANLFSPDQKRTGSQPHDDQQASSCRCSHDALVTPSPLVQPLGPGRRLRRRRLPFQDVAQVVGQLLGRGIAILPAFGHRLQDDRLQVGRDLRLPLPQPHGVLLFDLTHQPRSVLAGQRRPQRQQLVQRDSQRVDVRPLVDQRGVPQGLLGTHVAQRPHDIARLGQRRIGLAASQAKVRHP